MDGSKALKWGHRTYFAQDPSIPHKLLVTQGAANSFHVTIRTDTGAGISLINIAFARKAQLRLLPHTHKMTARYANNSPMPIHYTWRVPSRAPLVAPIVEWNVTLGTGFLQKHSCDIHFYHKTASIIFEPATKTISVDDISNSSHRPDYDWRYHLSLDDQVSMRLTLEPFSTIFVWPGQMVERARVFQYSINAGDAKPTKLLPRWLRFS